jgi:hypothetical protein
MIVNWYGICKNIGDSVEHLLLFIKKKKLSIFYSIV